MLGTVYKSTGSWYKVKLENGEFVDCKLFGKFRTKNLKSTNPCLLYTSPSPRD